MTPEELLSHCLSLVGGLGVRENPPFRLVSVRGPDAAEFLQRLCTQDVRGLADGEIRPAAFLDSKGKLLVTCLVFRLDGRHWLETPEATATALLGLLERYHFTEKLTIEAAPLVAQREWVAAARGGETGNRAVMHEHPVVHFERRGVAFTRSYAPGFAPSIDRAEQPLSPELAECLRLLAGQARVGVETEPTTLALEADLDDHVSTTKGCYTGQEIVARIHTYGHVNRKLCLVQLAPGAAITAPVPLHEPEDRLAVGRVMHAVPVPGASVRLGVGFVPRDFQALGSKLELGDGAAVEVIGYEPLGA